MPKESKQIIKKEAKKLFAQHGYEGFSIRTLADHSGLGISSIYHFFKDKDVLLEEIFNEVNTQLGVKRSLLPKRRNASESLKDRIKFQFNNMEDIVFVLKYYLHFRNKYNRNPEGFLPVKAYLHIDEVLRMGLLTEEFKFDFSELSEQSKVVAHAINGFLLEYYPYQPKGNELNELVKSIHKFLMRSLTNKEVMV